MPTVSPLALHSLRQKDKNQPACSKYHPASGKITCQTATTLTYLCSHLLSPSSCFLFFHILTYMVNFFVALSGLLLSFFSFQLSYFSLSSRLTGVRMSWRAMWGDTFPLIIPEQASDPIRDTCSTSDAKKNKSRDYIYSWRQIAFILKCTPN